MHGSGGVSLRCCTCPYAQRGSEDVGFHASCAFHPAGARLPAPCAAGSAASVTPGGLFSAGDAYTTHGLFCADDTYTTAAYGCPCHAAGVPPTTSAPTPTSRSPYGDTTRGWYPAAPGSRGLAATPVNRRSLLYPLPFVSLVRTTLAPRDGRRVRGAPCQPDMRSGTASAWLQCRHRQVDLDAQAAG